MRPIRTEADIIAAVPELIAIDPAFAKIAEAAGPIPLRHRPPDYEGLASIIVSQMVSRASADAIWGRLVNLIGSVTPASILAFDATQLRSVGLSGAKEITLRSLAEACRDGLDLAGTAELPAEQAIAELTAIRGIGPWTAEVFLLFCAGHPDIFPAGDVALQSATRDAFNLSERPDARLLSRMSSAWQPLRSIAARLLWAYYAVTNRRDAMPLA